MNALLIVLVLLAVAYGGLALVAWRFGDRLILPAPGSSYRAGRFPHEVPLTAADGTRLAAVHLPHDGARFTILYSHGNGEDLGTVMWVLERLNAMGFEVFAYDYRGYGASEGRATVDGVLLDAEAAYRHVTEALHVPAERLILWGRSVGGGPTVHLAARRPVAGMVLEATFTSAFCVATRRPILWWDRFCNLDQIRDVRVPLLSVHGRRDRVVPFGHGQRLFEGAPGPKRSLWIDGAGHNDLWLVAGDRLRREVLDFADSLDEARSSAA